MKYHKQLGFPNTIVIPKNILVLHYSDHAVKKIRELNILTWPKTWLIGNQELIEIETPNNIWIKEAVIRIPNNYKTDLSLALLIFRTIAVVKTIWLNNAQDNHETLDKSKYDLPDNNNSKEIDEIYAGITNKPLN